MSETQDERSKNPKDARFTAPAVSLPKGGGAIRGIGEKFGANPGTGTGSLSIPRPLSGESLQFSRPGVQAVEACGASSKRQADAMRSVLVRCMGREGECRCQRT
jgi:hypothetical protein